MKWTRAFTLVVLGCASLLLLPAASPASTPCSTDGTPCELTGRQRELQWLIREVEPATPGVCRRGSCMPRAQCVELCNADLAERIDVLVHEQLRACLAGPDKPDKETCEVGLSAETSPVVETTGNGLVECALACGNPPVPPLP